jgi:hypothetical protein
MALRACMHLPILRNTEMEPLCGPRQTASVQEGTCRAQETDMTRQLLMQTRIPSQRGKGKLS